MHRPEDAPGNPYLQQEVHSASPSRLRWMLICRAEELCGAVDAMWQQGDAEGAVQWQIRIRDILGELLSGVQDADNPLSGRVCDFYIFLLKLQSQAEETRDREQLATLRGLLQIEAETWRQVVHRQGSEGLPEGAVESSIETRPADSGKTLASPPPPPATGTVGQPGYEPGMYTGTAGLDQTSLGGESFSLEV